MISLTAREQLIFAKIMSLYCNGDNTPVASGHVANNIGVKVSSATIRNTMAKLEKVGLLYSPHTSAGRVPTANGYNYWFNEFFNLRDLAFEWQPQLQELTSLAHQLSQEFCVCIVLGLPEATTTLVYRVEVIDFNSSSWLVLLIDKDGQSNNVLINKPIEANDELRTQFNMWLNTVFSGQRLHEGLRRMQAMANSAPMFCRGSITMWITSLAQQLSIDNSIVIGSNHLFDTLPKSMLDKLGAPLLNDIDDKLAFKNGVSILHHQSLPYQELDACLLIAIPYFEHQVYRNRLCVICRKSDKIEAIINEIAQKCS